MPNYFQGFNEIRIFLAENVILHAFLETLTIREEMLQVTRDTNGKPSIQCYYI